MSQNKLNTLAAALGLALAGPLAVPSDAAAQGGFSLVPLERGYLLSDHGQEEGAAKKGEEGKCGEGKCGEGRCGGDQGDKGDEGDKGDKGDRGDKGEEGKCGEGKCGEGKCGSA
jgi:uncharacterized low-complexity protein